MTRKMVLDEFFSAMKVGDIISWREIDKFLMDMRITAHRDEVEIISDMIETDLWTSGNLIMFSVPAGDEYCSVFKKVK